MKGCDIMFKYENDVILKSGITPAVESLGPGWYENEEEELHVCPQCNTEWVGIYDVTMLFLHNRKGQFAKLYFYDSPDASAQIHICTCGFPISVKTCMLNPGVIFNKNLNVEDLARIYT
jgi:hypothetical protein